MAIKLLRNAQEESRSIWFDGLRTKTNRLGAGPVLLSYFTSLAVLRFWFHQTVEMGQETDVACNYSYVF